MNYPQTPPLTRKQEKMKHMLMWAWLMQGQKDAYCQVMVWRCLLEWAMLGGPDSFHLVQPSGKESQAAR
jgi:hypothetical protein